MFIQRRRRFADRPPTIHTIRTDRESQAGLAVALGRRLRCRRGRRPLQERLLHLIQYAPQDDLLMGINRIWPRRQWRRNGNRPTRVDLLGAVGCGEQRATGGGRERGHQPPPLARAGRGCRPSIGIVHLGHSCGFSLKAIPFGLARYRMQVVQSVAVVLRRSISQASPKMSSARWRGAVGSPHVAHHVQFQRAIRRLGGIQSPCRRTAARANALLPPNVVSGRRGLKFRPMREFITAMAAPRGGRQDMPPDEFFSKPRGC